MATTAREKKIMKNLETAFDLCEHCFERETITDAIVELTRLFLKNKPIVKHDGFSPIELDALKHCQNNLCESKIEAIKYYRSVTGKGLRDAKHDIENLAVWGGKKVL